MAPAQNGLATGEPLGTPTLGVSTQLVRFEFPAPRVESDVRLLAKRMSGGVTGDENPSDATQISTVVVGVAPVLETFKVELNCSAVTLPGELEKPERPVIVIPPTVIGAHCKSVAVPAPQFPVVAPIFQEISIFACANGARMAINPTVKKLVILFMILHSSL